MKYEDVERLLTELGWKQDQEFPEEWSILSSSMYGTYPTRIILNYDTMTLFKAVYEMSKNEKQ